MTESIRPLRNKEVLEESLTLLRKFTRSRSSDTGILMKEELFPLEKLYRDLGYWSSIVPRVMLVGEFKAGKSTLINALLGGDYAAVDVLEMTSWIARYWPSGEDFCRITTVDGEDLYMDPREFYFKCMERSFTQEEIDRIERVDIGLSGIFMPFILIDCPGFGSVTRENEKRLINALGDSDVILWTVDVDSVGGIREGTLMKKLLSHDMPVIVALTKCDLLESEQEFEEIKEYIVSLFGVDEEKVFPTSALKTLEAMRNSRPLPEDCGIQELRDFLIKEISPRNVSLRRKAEKAHLLRIFELEKELLERVEGEIEKAAEALAKFKRIVDSMGEYITHQVSSRVEGEVKETLFGEKRELIIQDLEEEMRSGKGKLTREQIEFVFKKHLGESYLDEYWAEIIDRVVTLSSSIWKERIQDAEEELSEIYSQLNSSVTWHEVSVDFNLPELRSKVARVYDSEFEKGVKASLGLAAISSALSAWVGPYALGVGAAITGVGIPVFIVGVGVHLAYQHFKAKKEEENYRSYIHGLVSRFVAEFSGKVVRPLINERISKINRDIGNILVKSSAEKIMYRLPHGDMDELLEEVRRLKKLVSSELSIIGK